MVIFGKAKGGGRRRSAREQSPLVLSTVSTVNAGDYRVGLVNLSSTGALLTAPHLPAQGEHVVFRADRITSLGHIAWSSDGQCGIAFESPMSARDVAHVRRIAVGCISG